MEESKFDEIKTAVLDHIQMLFNEMEQEMAVSHQEKYALLEDALENASDEDELYVAFERWYKDHSDEVEFDHEFEELWDHALGNMEE